MNMLPGSAATEAWLALEAARGADVTELQTRIASSAVLAPLALAAVLVGGLPFAVLIAVMAGAGLAEWTGIAGAPSPALRIGAITLLCAGLLTLALSGDHRLGAALLGAPTLLALAVGLRDHAFRWLGYGLVYVALPSAGLLLLRQAEPYGWAAVLFILAVVWATDVAAFFGGRAIGGPKLWPRVSPKKTWAGAISGFVAALLVGGIVTILAGSGAFWVGAALAAPLAIAAEAGDLLESAVKRRFGVKDSGTTIPGHGGVLDRVDGLLGAAALAWLIAALGFGGGVLALPASVAATGNA